MIVIVTQFVERHPGLLWYDGGHQFDSVKVLLRDTSLLFFLFKKFYLVVESKEIYFRQK